MNLYGDHSDNPPSSGDCVKQLSEVFDSDGKGKGKGSDSEGKGSDSEGKGKGSDSEGKGSDSYGSESESSCEDDGGGGGGSDGGKGDNCNDPVGICSEGYFEPDFSVDLPSAVPPNCFCFMDTKLAAGRPNVSAYCPNGGLAGDGYSAWLVSENKCPVGYPSDGVKLVNQTPSKNNGTVCLDCIKPSPCGSNSDQALLRRCMCEDGYQPTCNVEPHAT